MYDMLCSVYSTHVRTALYRTYGYRQVCVFSLVSDNHGCCEEGQAVSQVSVQIF